MSSLDFDVAFRAIADFTYDWETWIGPDGSTRWVNPAVIRMTGWTPRECLELEHYPLPIVHLEDRDRVHEALRGAATGTSGNDLEFRVMHREGGIRWVAMSWQSLVLPDGSRLGYRTSVREITSRKRLEGQLRDALERAHVADRARASFLANVSHELRTPLNNLLGHIELLGGTSLEAGSLGHVQVIRDQATILLRLVDDLLDVAAHDVQRTPRVRQTLTPLPLLTRWVEAHRPGIEATGLTLRTHFDFGPDAQIQGDADALGHILRNLLDNAQKYTPHGTIDVRGRLAYDPNCTLVLEIEDTGLGMDPERIDDLRQPLVRGSESVEHYVPGAGLGLAIVDRLCDQLGGRLVIESGPGRGTRVEVRVPAERENECAPPSEPILDWTRLRILIVDDNATGRELTEQQLLGLGCTVATAAHGREALELADEQPFDLVLMDLHMPGLGGEATARLLRAQRPTHGVVPRIVALTADVFGAAEATLRGFDAQVTKPIQREQLRRVVQAIASSEEPDPPIDQIFDRRKLEELRSVRTTEGETFLARFAPRVVAELQELARLVEQPPPRDGHRLCDLAHRIRNSANIVGAHDLAQEAARLQDLADRGEEEPRDLITSITARARTAASALKRLL